MFVIPLVYVNTVLTLSGPYFIIWGKGGEPVGRFQDGFAPFRHLNGGIGPHCQRFLNRNSAK